jgi:hypothetical protein
MLRLIVLALFVTAFALSACNDGDSNGSEPTPGATTTAGQQTAAPGGGTEFGQLVLASAINPDTKEPVTEVTSFPTSAPEMHATLQVKNVPAGGQFIFRWTKGASVAATITVPVEEAVAESWVAGSVRPPGAIPVGDDWLVAVSFNGVAIGSVTFSVR